MGLSHHEVAVADLRIAADRPLTLIAGPCAIESREHALMMARAVKEICAGLGIPLIYKSSFDKANRTSHKSARGLGLDKALPILAEVRERFGCPVLTDVHEAEQCAAAAEHVDVLQIPAFLCRQTDFVQAVGRAGKPVNVKKGQFLAPQDVVNIVEKLREVGNEDVLLTDRGTSFGYSTLVTDFRGLATMQRLTGMPVCYDATHSVQQPAAMGTATGGDRSMVPLLARAAAAVGINALFMEVHDNPPAAKSDGPTQVWLDQLEDVLRGVLAIDRALREWNASPAR